MQGPQARKAGQSFRARKNLLFPRGRDASHPYALSIAPQWYERLEAGDGVLRLWEPHVHPFARANIWYVLGRDRDLLIDAGTGLRPLMPELPGFSRLGGHPVLAVATHIHFDHVGALHEFPYRCAHAAEASHYSAMPDQVTMAELFRELPRPVEALPRADWHPRHYRVPAAPIHTPLQDLDAIDLGDRQLIVLHLPGHSPGSIGLLDAKHGLLFCGDALYDGELIDSFDTSDIPDYRATMRRLRELEIRIVHGGHGESFGPSRKNQLIREYLDGRRRQGCPSLE